MKKSILVFVTLIISTLNYEAFKKDFSQRLSEAAIELTHDNVIYDPSYVRLDYPMGDVPKNKGVCTDVIIRAYRKLGIDLQKEVHQDMSKDFSEYPNLWKLSKPDRNIDHRRVPNLQTFFTRHGESLPVSQNASDYQTGDLVTWMIDGKLPHIGIVTHIRTSDGQRPLIVHNIGSGQVLEDCLFLYPVTGRYRYHKTP